MGIKMIKYEAQSTVNIGNIYKLCKASASVLTPLAYIPVGNEVIAHFKRIGAVHGVYQRFPIEVFIFNINK